MALIFADSYCGKAKWKGWTEMDPAYQALLNEWFSEDEQTLIHWCGSLSDDDRNKYRFSADDLKFFPNGTDNKPEYYYIFRKSPYSYKNVHYCIVPDGSMTGYDNELCTNVRPLIWVKYDCIPVKKEEKEKK